MLLLKAEIKLFGVPANAAMPLRLSTSAALTISSKAIG